MGKGKVDPEERKARVRARIEQSGNLPTLPGVVARIMEMLDDEHTTARQLGANAVIAFSLDFDNIGSKGKSLIMAYGRGTAVVLQ